MMEGRRWSGRGATRQFENKENVRSGENVTVATGVTIQTTSTHVREARGHGRYNAHRDQRVPRHLRARSVRRSIHHWKPEAGATTTTRPDLPQGEVPAAVVDDIVERNASSQPVLVGC